MKEHPEAPEKEQVEGELKCSDCQRRKKTLLLILVLLLVVIFATFVGWWFFSYEPEGGTSQEETSPEFEQDSGDESQEATITESEAKEDEGSGTVAAEDEVSAEEGPLPAEDGYIAKRLLCDGYGGIPADKYYMDIEYPEFVEVSTWDGPDISDAECNLEFRYEDSVMRITFNVGESYLSTLDEGFWEIGEKDGKTMVRTNIDFVDATHWYSYRWKADDTECVPSDFDPSLTPPCAWGHHPFLPGASQVSVLIPGTLGASELGDIVDLFSDIAMRLSGGET